MRKNQPKIPNSTVNNQYRCYACGDIADAIYEKRSVCQECYQELAHGIVVNQNINFFGGISARPEDGPGPCQENAIRQMEGL